jgi:hypothetical protein
MNYCYYGRKEYKPGKDNLAPIKDVYWKLDDFIEATKNPKNQNKFITMEEQGVEQYKSDFWRGDVQGFDKITQIFGVDETNLLINLPYIFDLVKGTRLKGHYLLRAIRKSRKRVDIIVCKKGMLITTDKAFYYPVYTWESFPDLEPLYPAFVNEYEKLKKKYNLEKKDEELAKAKGLKKRKGPLVPHKPIFGRI